MFYPMYYTDYTMVILLPAIILAAYAQFKVSSATNKYFKVRSMNGYTGEQAANRILSASGIYDVKVRAINGNLTDHYDPRNRVLSLSQDVFYGNSITSVSIAAHECGHAIQHARGYAPLSLRSAMVPVVNFASQASWFLIFLGFFMSGNLLNIGIILFSLTVLFQLITLPVEFNASSRGISELTDLGIITYEEKRKSKKVLSAAAL
ncbi:MAG: zinc metallopeptidase, partial [Clostridioides sp.]|nr:zinc metallopeptidase [Clostridioides sp.]